MNKLEARQLLDEAMNLIPKLEKLKDQIIEANYEAACNQCHLHSQYDLIRGALIAGIKYADSRPDYWISKERDLRIRTLHGNLVNSVLSKEV